MTRRPSLLVLPLALALLTGCSGGARAMAEDRPAGSTGTPASAKAPPPAPPPAPAPAPASPPGSAAPSSSAPDEGPSAVYVVKDSGMRCIAAPCPSLVARPVDPPGAEGLRITGLDLSALGLSDEQEEHLQNQAHSGGPGLRVEATVTTRPHAGPAGAATELRVRRVLEGP